MARKKSRRESFKGANGTGSVFERPNGNWQAQVTVGRRADGSQRRLTKTLPTKNEATAWARKVLVGVEDGTFTEPSRATVADLLEHWQASNPQWSEASLNDNVGTLRRHVIPTLGRARVADLTPAMVQSLVNDLRLKPALWPPRPKDSGRVNPPLSEAMIRRVLARFRALLNHGVRMQVIGKNAALGVRLPKVDPQPNQAWTLQETQAMVAHCLENPGVVENYILVALATGLRVQELRGLPWSNVNLGERNLTVQQVAVDGRGGVRIKSLPKTPAGYRVVDFDDTAALAFERQEGREGLVFSSGDRPLGIGQLRRAFKRIAALVGARVIPLYDTRATHGTLLAEAGVNPKIISERLGHTDVAFSMKTYVRPGRVEHKAAAGVMGSLLRAATHQPLTVETASGDNSKNPTGTQTNANGDSA